MLTDDESLEGVNIATGNNDFYSSGYTSFLISNDLLCKPSFYVAALKIFTNFYNPPFGP